MSIRTLLLIACGMGAVHCAAAPPATSDLIDRHIRAQWPPAQSAAEADDAQFLRRVSLDLTGHILRVFEVREFLADGSPDKRARAVERMLASPDFARHMATVWRTRMLPDSANPQSAYFAAQLEAWLRGQFKENVPWDKIASSLLNAPPPAMDEMRGRPAASEEAGPGVYYQAMEYKPENIAGATSRLLLGVNLECAQCHDHPTAQWKREQFWQYAAFFAEQAANGQRLTGEMTPAVSARSIRIPKTDVVVNARFLDGAEPDFAPFTQTTGALSAWMTAKGNPYFAASLANKMWAHFFGIGLLDPLDEPGRENPPSHPELLDALAKDFVAHGYDVKHLVRGIVNSKAYQLSSSAGGPETANGRLFARMPVRGLSPEQIYDSLILATGHRDGQPTARDALLQGYQGTSGRAEFLSRFNNRADRPTEAQTTILQALSLMNGQLVARATDLRDSETLAAVGDASFMSAAEKIETLFIAALSRPPSADELARFTRHVESAADQGRALSDVFWVLLNTAEFRTNH